MSKYQLRRHMRLLADERALMAYQRWLEVRNYRAVGEWFEVGRSYAQQLVRRGWRIEAKINPGATTPGSARI